MSRRGGGTVGEGKRGGGGVCMRNELLMGRLRADFAGFYPIGHASIHTSQVNGCVYLTLAALIKKKCGHMKFQE